jgi:hypothetical protein
MYFPQTRFLSNPYFSAVTYPMAAVFCTAYAQAPSNKTLPVFRIKGVEKSRSERERGSVRHRMLVKTQIDPARVQDSQIISGEVAAGLVPAFGLWSHADSEQQSDWRPFWAFLLVRLGRVTFQKHGAEDSNFHLRMRWRVLLLPRSFFGAKRCRTAGIPSPLRPRAYHLA